MDIWLKKSGILKLKQGVPYLSKEDIFEQLPKEGSIVTLVDDTNQQWHGYVGKEHQSDIAILAESPSAQFIAQVIKKAQQRRQQAFVNLPACYRLIHNEADGLPGVTIELFANFAVCTYFNRGILGMEKWITEALSAVLPLQGIYAKYRTLQAITPETKLIWGIPAPENLVVCEENAQYIVKLNAGLMTGLFLDQRANRMWLQSNSKAKTVCNTFSYTGALSVSCALGKAATTLSVDLSATYSAWAQENIALNNLQSKHHTTLVSDTFAHFEYCQRRKIKYDLIILDPPTFAKKKGGNFAAGNDYGELMLKALPLLNTNGVLVCSTNFSQWSLEEFRKLLLTLGKKYGYILKIIHESQADKDFPIHPHWPASNHLKFIALQVG